MVVLVLIRVLSPEASFRLSLPDVIIPADAGPSFPRTGSVVVSIVDVSVT